MLPEPKIDWEKLVNTILLLAKNQGATSAEVSGSVSSGFSVDVRLGEVETVEYNRDKGIDITVYFGKQKGSASTSDLAQDSIEKTVAAACHIARFTSEDDCAGLADPELMAYHYPDLDLYHPWQITVEEGIVLAKECEELGRKADKRIVNSDGSGLSTHEIFYIYGNSHGFIGYYSATRHSLSCVLIAQEGSKMQKDYSYTIARDAQDLESVTTVARLAAERTLRRLNARRLSTRKVPVIFEADIATGLLGAFLQAIQGSSLYKNSSFLVDHLGKQVFPDMIHIYEQPYLKKGLGSSPFDAEGVKTLASDIVANGVLQRYILSSYSARKLGMQTTGNAGGVHNLSVDTSDLQFNDLLKKMGTGLLVTELIGQGVNIVTGDYSRGAAGFWVENGVIQYPVEEITVAGNLRDMFRNLVAISNDVEKRGNVRTGSILLESMTIAGE